METAENGGGGVGKIIRKQTRRYSKTTPYDRPPTAIRINNNISNTHNPSLLSKLVSPASRLIYAGADKLFGAFRKRLPAIAPPEPSAEPKNGFQAAKTNVGSKDFVGVSEPITDEGGNLASSSAATDISELENMLKHKNFTRSEIERLTALLDSRTTESGVGEGDKAKLPNSPHILRLEASTSGTLNKPAEETENYNAAISTPVLHSRIFEEDIASPAELAKAFMGRRLAKVSPLPFRSSSQAPRHDSVLLNSTTILPRTPSTSLAPRTAVTGYANSLTTPRSRGRSAIYNMPRTPYNRGPSTSSQKVATSPLLLSSQPAWEHEGTVESSKMAVKRRSSVLDDFGSSGPVRRIRQKANLPSYGSSLLKHRSELVSSQKALSRPEPESKAFKGVEENGETSKRNLGYASVPTESIQMASKIFEQLERMSPKEKPSGSRLALGNLEKVDSPKFLPSSEDHRKSESQHRTPEATFQSKDKFEETGLKAAVSRNGHSLINRNSTVPVGGNSLIIANTDSSLNPTAEPPQKKRAFQMSAHEELQELNTDNHSNGHVSTPLAEFKKPAISVNANKDEPSFINKQTGYNFHTSRPSSSNSQPAEYSQSFSIRDTVVLREATPVCTSTESVANVSPSLLSVMEPSEVKSNISPDAKSLGSTSNFNSRMEKDHWQFSASNNNDNGNTQKSTNMLGKEHTLISASPTTASTSGIFSFSHSTNNTSIASPTPASTSGVFPFGGATNKTSIANGNPASSSSTFASSTSIPAVGSNANQMFSSSPTNNATLITTGSLAGFSSPAVASTTNESQLKTQNSTAVKQAVPVNFGTSSSFVFGTARTTSSTSGSATAPSFGLSSAIASSDIKSGSSTSNSPSNLFGSGFSSTPSFGLSSTVALSETKSVGSTNVSTTTASSPPQSSVSGFTAPFSFGVSSTTSMPSTSSLPIMFGLSNAGTSTGSSMFSIKATGAASSSSPAPVFEHTTPASGTVPNNNDQMNMEDSMAEDIVQTPSQTSAFAQASSGTPTPGFVFGSGTSTSSTTPFQFGGQTNQAPSPNPFQASSPNPFQAPSPNLFQAPVQNPFQAPSQSPFQASSQNLFQASSQNTFQASGSAEFSAGGSFSLGSGGGDKSGRKFVKVKRTNKRK
uniref:nuclear pore complex protein NUP1-like isoform X1 n=1 Tax=Erigeron canadensis TaxID=72917 RepID=UPI001CB95C63|nr:nuclear pore complex protein NUP1-like isoform X1 [Erigeron canadensis]